MTHLFAVDGTPSETHEQAAFLAALAKWAPILDDTRLEMWDAIVASDVELGMRVTARLFALANSLHLEARKVYPNGRTT